MLERLVGIWQGLLQITKTYMCLMMEAATTGEHLSPGTHCTISICLLGSVMLRVVLLTAESITAPSPWQGSPTSGQQQQLREQNNTDFCGVPRPCRQARICLSIVALGLFPKDSSISAGTGRGECVGALGSISLLPYIEGGRFV